MSETILHIQGVTKTYKKSHLGRTTYSRGIVNVNLSVNKGEIYGLLGLNGSGKTTTIKLALGLLNPTQGDITILDHPVPHPFSQQRIGYLPEVPYFYRNLNPLEVLNLYGSLSKMNPKSIRSRIDEVLTLVKMGHVRKKPMREFSKGMLQRIGLAQAILHDPDLLIMDEPVTGLDPMALHSVRSLLLDLNQKGKTILFSSHSLSELEKLSNRVGILVEGKLVREVEKKEWASSPGQLESIFLDTLKKEGTEVVA